MPALLREVSRVFGLEPQQLEALKLDDKNTEELGDVLWVQIKASYDEKEKMVGPDLHPAAAKVLATLDREWDGLARHRDFQVAHFDPDAAGATQFT